MIEQNKMNHKEVKDLVIKKIKDKESLFLVRFGDGEMRIELEHESLPEFCVKQFGKTLTSEEIKTAKDWMEKAVLESTIIGLPDEGHIKANYLWSSLLDYYERVKNKNNENYKEKRYCSINIHYQLKDSGDLFEIIKQVKKIVIVSPRDVVEKMKTRFNNLTEIEYYSLPAEQAYEVNKNKNIDIFEKIPEICQSMSKKNRQGELLIFGAGPLGKIIGSEFCKSGGVALDIGSVFDLFVGKITRGKGKGPESKMNPIL